MAAQQVYIDHLLLQFSKDQFESLPTFISDEFAVIDGGVHTGGFSRSPPKVGINKIIGVGGLSRNKLIVFGDGTYLELYNWITKPEDWKERLPGDFALTALEPISAEDSQKRIVQALAGTPGDGGLGVTYYPPHEGGRKSPQGENIRWEIVKAAYSLSDNTPAENFYPRGRRTDAPFFCHDLTPRLHRVTYDLPSVTKHPSGATGIAGIEVLVPKDRYDYYVDLYSSIVGAAPQRASVENDVGSAEFRLCAPGDPSLFGFIRIRPSRSGAEETFLREKGIGLYSLTIRSDTRGDFSFPVFDLLH